MSADLKKREEVEYQVGDRNLHILVCPRCGSRILSAGVAVLVSEQRFIPSAREGGRIKPDGETDSSEPLSEFWQVNDKFDFDNVGFSNTVQDVTKYLCCADCEVGPLGVHRLDETPEKYLVAADRVRYKGN